MFSKLWALHLGEAALMDLPSGACSIRQDQLEDCGYQHWLYPPVKELLGSHCLWCCLWKASFLLHTHDNKWSPKRGNRKWRLPVYPLKGYFGPIPEGASKDEDLALAASEKLTQFFFAEGQDGVISQSDCLTDSLQRLSVATHFSRSVWTAKVTSNIYLRYVDCD